MIRFLFSFSIILLLVLNSCNSRTANNDSAANDSIKKYLDSAKDESLPFDKRIDFNDKAFKYVANFQNSPKNRECIYEIISNYYPLKDWGKYKRATDFYYKNSQLSNDVKALAQSYRSYGNYYYNLQLLDSSFYFYTKSENIYKSIKDFDGLSTVLYKKGQLQYKIDDFLGADLSLLKAFFYVKKTNDNLGKYRILNELGLVYNDLQKYSDAISYFEEAIKISRKNLQKEKGLDIVPLSNIGLVYQNLKKHNVAISYFESSLKFTKIKEDFPQVYSNIIDNLAYSKFKLKYNKKLPYLFFESLKIREQIKDTSGIIISNIHLSEYYFSINENQEALEYANTSLRLSKLNKNAIRKLLSLKQLIKLDKINATKYADIYLEIFESLQLAQRDSKDRFDRIQLKTDEITQEKNEEVKQKWIIGSVLASTLLIVMLLLIITRQQNKQKQLKLLQDQQKANEEIYNLMLTQKEKEDKARQTEKTRIARELHDGVMNRLSSTRLNLDILKHKKDTQTIAKCLVYVDELYQIEQEIRDISHDLSLEGFKTHDSFVALINDFVSTQNKISQTQYKLEIDSTINWNSISSIIKMNLYRITQEASSNINKFANAKKTMISFILDGNNICLSITDDGRGFDTESKSEGIGLKNIKQRVEALKGKFFIQSIKNKSTSINIAIPIL